jgi:hypothetical protein
MGNTRTAATLGSAGETTLAQAYWCSTRLVNHGWRLHHYGCDATGRGYFTAHTPEGQCVTVHEGAVPASSLQAQLCTAVSRLVDEGHRTEDDYLHRLSLMLRVRRPARRPVGRQLQPWPIPVWPLTRQPAQAVRIAYWLFTVLTDDYGWDISDIDGAGFTAIIPGQPELPVRYDAEHRHKGTTSAELIDRLATLTEYELHTLQELLGRHARQPATVSGGQPTGGDRQ